MRPGWQRPAALSVRRAFLWLLVIALLPLVLLGVSRGILQLQRSQAMASASLSQRAIETARWQTEVVRTTHAMLVLLAKHPDVRAGGLFCDMALRDVDSGFAALASVARFGSDGSLVCASTEPMPQMNVASRPWWPVARDTGRFFVTGPVLGRLSQRQVLIAIQPLTRADGSFDGLLSASIDMAWMQRSLRSGGLGPDAIALVLDGAGHIVASSRSPPFDTIATGLRAGQIGQATDTGGRDWTYALAPLITGIDGRHTLYVAYAVPRVRLFSATWFQAGITLLQPLLAVAISSLVIWFGTNALVLRWLRELRLLARDFSRGNYRARLPDLGRAPAEIRALAAALYRMGRAAGQRDRALRAAMARQGLLVRETHHRVKNNLQIVTSLLSLQAARSASGDTTLGLTRLRISTLALVHRLFYETGEQGAISSTKLLGGVCKLLDQFLGKRDDIEVHCHLADTEVTLDTAIPLCTWLAEATSNAWLHAFPDGRRGTIIITLTLDDDEGVLDVVDDGIGFDVGGPGSRPAARGLRILSSIAKQLGGQSSLESTSATGTRVRLRYPLHQPAMAP